MNDLHLPAALRERLLRCEEERRAGFDGAPVPMALASPDGRWLRVNDALARRLGLEPEGLAGKPIEEQLHPEDGRIVGDLVNEVRGDRERTVGRDLRLRSAGGDYAWVHARVSAPTQECLSWVFLEAERRHAPGVTVELLERVFSSVHVLLAYMDRDFNFVKVNEAYAAADGHAPGYFVGRNHFDLYPNPENEAIFRRAIETGEAHRELERAFVYPGHPERGTTYWDWTAQPVTNAEGEVDGLLLSLLNVTDRVEAKRRLEGAAHYARSLIEANPDPMVTITLDGFITDANGAFLAATGRSREEVVGSLYTDHVGPAATAAAGLAKAVAEGQVRDVELDLLHVDGHTTPVLYNANIFRDARGQVAGVLAVARDVSSLKRAEAEVARLNLWNRLVLDAAGEGIYGIDREGRCIVVNPAMLRLLGYDATDEVLGKSAHALFHHSRGDGTPYPFEECPAHRAFRGGIVSRGTGETYWRKDGSAVTVEYVSTPIRDGDRVIGAVVTVVDVTERKRAERLLRLSAKEQEGIARLGLRALAGEPLVAVMDGASRLVADCLDVELCKVLELLPGGGSVLLRAGVGWKEGLIGSAMVGTGRDSQAGYTLQTGKPIVVKDLRSETRFSGSPLLQEHGVVSGMSVVIPGREGPFGVLSAHTTREREFSQDDVNFLMAVANVIAVAVERAQGEERLRAASAYNRRLIEASLDPLVTIGPDGTITDVNGATEAITGRSRHQLIGTDFSDYFADPEKARAGYQQVFRDGVVRDYPLDICHADGRLTPVLYNASVYRDAQGQVAGVFAAARDITERKRSEEALRRSEARLNKAQEIAHLGSWELDLVTGVLEWSDEIYRVFEIDKATFGASYEAFLNTIHPDDRAAVDEAYTRSLEARTPYAIDHRLLFSDGRIKFVHEQCETVFAEDGRPLRSIGTVQDISERKRAEETLRESESRYRSLFERMFDGYAVHRIVLDPAGRPCDYIFTEVNPAFERMTGLRRDQVIGRRVTEVLPQTEPQWIEVYGEVALTGEGRRFEQYARAFDRYFEVAAFSPGPRQFATVFSDITERRRAQQALRTLNTELERRVKERTAALEAANQELESFSFSVSHDLRTPLRAVDGFSRILLSEYGTKLDAEGQRLLQVVRDNAQRMEQLIGDILHFSRTGRAEMRKGRVEMAALVDEAWAELMQGHPERQVELRRGELPPAVGDGALLRQVLLNLLGNAIKFTRPRAGAVVEVGAEAADGEIVYHVKDNGVGFDMHYVEKLFGLFQRLHGPDEFEGTGIGLAIVKRIIARHGGRVWAEGRPGEGATFYFTLPKEDPWTGN